MTLTKTRHGVTYNIAQDEEDEDWGSDTTNYIAVTGDDVEATTARVGSVPVVKSVSTSTTLAASATLTQTNAVHIISGDGGDVTLDATTAIADGSTDGIELTLIVGANGVTVLDGANTDLRGPFIGETGDKMRLRWSEDNSNWEELFRNT